MRGHPGSPPTEPRADRPDSKSCRLANPIPNFGQLMPLEDAAQPDTAGDPRGIRAPTVSPEARVLPTAVRPCRIPTMAGAADIQTERTPGTEATSRTR